MEWVESLGGWHTWVGGVLVWVAFLRGKRASMVSVGGVGDFLAWVTG